MCRYKQTLGELKKNIVQVNIVKTMVSPYTKYLQFLYTILKKGGKRFLKDISLLKLVFFYELIVRKKTFRFKICIHNNWNQAFSDVISGEF